jgi:hypothetical protein
MNVRVCLLDKNHLNSSSSIEVSCKGDSRRFESDFLGLLQAVAHAMSFGRPITFWAGSRAVENVDGFETLIKGQSLCIL